MQHGVLQMKKKTSKLLKKLVVKRIVKPSRISYKIPEVKTEGVLEDPNRFFKDEYEKEKRSLFMK